MKRGGMLKSGKIDRRSGRMKTVTGSNVRLQASSSGEAQEWAAAINDHAATASEKGYAADPNNSRCRDSL